MPVSLPMVLIFREFKRIAIFFSVDMIQRRVELLTRLKALEEAAPPLISFLQNPNAVQELRADKSYNLQMLNDRYQVWV